MLQLIQLAAFAFVASTPAVESDYSILAAINAEEVVQPIASCAIARLLDHPVREGDHGNWAAAMKFIDASFSACGLEKAKNELRQRVVARRTDASLGDVERLVTTALAYSGIVALQLTATKFHLPLSSSKVAVPPTH